MKKVFILFVTIVCFSFFQIKLGHSQSNNVSLLGKWMNTYQCNAVYVNGNYAYVSSRNIMNILDILNPESIIGKGQYIAPSTSYISRIFVYDDYAYITYIAAGNSGLRIVDISNPMQPTETGFYNTEGRANGVIVSGDYAYIAADTSGLRIIDISNPSLPIEVGFINLGSSEAVDVTVQGNYVFIAYRNNGLQIIDVSNPHSPSIAGSFNSTNNNIIKVCVLEDYAYIIDNSSKNFYVLNISIVSAPSLAGSLSLGSFSGGQALFVSGDYAYIHLPDAYGCLRILDISNPFSPEYIMGGHYFTDNLDVNQFYVDENYAYLPLKESPGNSGLVIIDVSCPSSIIEKGKFFSDGAYIDIYSTEEYVYTLKRAFPYPYTFLKIFDVSEPSSPQIINSTFDVDATDLSKIFVSEDYLYITTSKNGGFKIFDISNPSLPVEIGSLNINGVTPTGIYVKDNYAFVCFQEYGLYIIDVSNPVSPLEISSFLLSGGYKALQVFVSGNYAYVTDNVNKLHIINISNPSEPFETGEIQMTSPPSGVIYLRGNNIFVKDNFAYVTIPSPSTGLVIIDISNPESPEIAGIYEAVTTAFDVYVKGQYAYLADRNNGLQIIDINNSSNPEQVAYYYDVNGYTSTVFADNDNVYLTTNNDLYVLKSDLMNETDKIYSRFSEYYIYPNPANDNISIQIMCEELKFSNLYIYDITGKKVFQSDMTNINATSGKDTYHINLSNFVSGVYFIKIENNENKYVSRFIKL